MTTLGADTPGDVLELVSAREGVELASLIGRPRDAGTARARQIAMTLLHDRLGLAFRQIGSLFGREHTTVRYDVRVGRGLLPASYLALVPVVPNVQPRTAEEIRMTTLREHLEAAYDAPADDEGRATFRIEGPDEASWSARKLRTAVDEIAEINRQWSEESARIDDWRKAAIARVDRDRAFFEGLLTDWLRRLLDRELAEEAGGDWSKVRHKSRALPSGVTVAARAGQAKWAIVDPAGFIEWAEAEHPELVRVKKEPNLAEAKKVLTAADHGGDELTVTSPEGEILDCIVVTPGETYTIAVKVEG